MTLNAARLHEAHESCDCRNSKEILWDEIQRSLPDAVTLCREAARQSQSSGKPACRRVSPRKHPDLTRQMAALLGVDRFRQLIEEDTQMCFILGACCAPIAAPTREAALEWLTWDRQLEFQMDSLFMC